MHEEIDHRVATTGGTRHRKTVLARRQFGDPSDWRSFLKSRGPVDSPIARAYNTRERNAGDNVSFFLLFFPASGPACNESRGWINCDSSVVFQYITTQGAAHNEVIPTRIPFVVYDTRIFFLFFFWLGDCFDLMKRCSFEITITTLM